MNSVLKSLIKKFYTDSIFVLCIIEIVAVIMTVIAELLYEPFKDNWLLVGGIIAFIEATIIFAIFCIHILCGLTDRYYEYVLEDIKNDNL